MKHVKFAVLILGLAASPGVRPLSLCLAEMPSVDCRVAQSAIRQASSIRNLAIKKPVPCLIEDREEVKRFLVDAVHHKVPQEKMYFDELVAKALGFIPEDYDYKSGLIDLYLSQLGGYYDPEKKRYVMAGWLPQMMQPAVAVHELTHALQDQYFDLQIFIDDVHFTTDRLLARAALVEGDATAVMLDYQRELTGQPSIATAEKVDSFIVQTVLGMALSTAQGGAPESLKAALLFPYASGTRFVHYLLRRGGYEAVTQAFRDPANTTEEILHPELYNLQKVSYRVLSPSELLPVAINASYQDSLGEFSISALLSGLRDKKELAATAASGWGGDLVVVYGERGHETVQWKIVWDSAVDADEFFRAYRDLLVTRAQLVKQSDSSSVEMGIDGRTLQLRLSGVETLLISKL